MLTDDFKEQVISTVHLGLNDSFSRKHLEDAIPNIICNEELNPPDVIDNNAIRFSVNNIVYEYSYMGFVEVPVAWMYDWINEQGKKHTSVYLGSHMAHPWYGLHNLRPLYLSPR